MHPASWSITATSLTSTIVTSTDEWGVNAQRPERVAALCRAQWRHVRFADVVTAGEGCLNYRDEAWPAGFPSDWNLMWERIAGALKHVSVANDGTVWGVNSDDKIYR